MNNNETELLEIENRLAESEKNKDEVTLLDLVSPTFEGVDPHGNAPLWEYSINIFAMRNPLTN